MNVIHEVFDSRNGNWTDDVKLNRLILKDRLLYLNELKHKNSQILTLKNAYDEFGLESRKECFLLGWSKYDAVQISFKKIDNDNAFLITFDCYPIYHDL